MFNREEAARARQSTGFPGNLLVVLTSFCLLVLLSWPIFLSFDLWILEDRASFLHLDELLAKHYRLGVDVFYSYGLLPVLLQHIVMVPFGRSYKPLLICTLIVLFLSACFWACLLQHLPQQRRWLIAVVALSEIVLVVNPNWPYSLAVLSIMFALLFVLRRRLDIALVLSAVGCFCVPSLTLALTSLIGLSAVVSWRLDPQRSVRSLVQLLLPGVLTYSALAVLLASFFGVASLRATILPLNGASFYKEMGYSGIGAFLNFVHPPGYSANYYLAYYIASPVTWFLLCSVFLLGLCLYWLRLLTRGTRPPPAAHFVSLYTSIHFLWICFAYGPRGQHVLYEGVLAAATLVGISTLPREAHRRLALMLFVTVGFLGEAGAGYKTLLAWRTNVRSPLTFGLYAEPVLAAELPEVLKFSQNCNTLALGYATGLQEYYPTLHEPDAWFLENGLVFPKQREAIADRIAQADCVVEVLATPAGILKGDAKMQAALADLEPVGSMVNFRLRKRKTKSITMTTPRAYPK